MELISEYYLYDNYDVLLSSSVLLGEEVEDVDDVTCPKCGGVFDVRIEVDPTFTYTSSAQDKNTAPVQFQDNSQ